MYRIFPGTCPIKQIKVIANPNVVVRSSGSTPLKIGKNAVLL